MAKDPKLLESQKNIPKAPTAEHLQTGVMELIDKHWKEMLRNLEACYEDWASQSSEEFPSPKTWAEFEVRAFVRTMRTEHSMDADKVVELVRTLPPMKEMVGHRDSNVKAKELGDYLEALHGIKAAAGTEEVTPENASELLEEPIRIRPGAYMRAMLSIAFHSFRHPLSTTVIDLQSGEAVSGETSEVHRIPTPSS